MQIAESATLKAGQWCPEMEKSRKSTTYPKRTRSRRFPTAPPRMSAKPSCSRTLLWEERSVRGDDQEDEDRHAVQDDRLDRGESTDAKRPNAAPLLRTYVRSKRSDTTGED